MPSAKCLFLSVSLAFAVASGVANGFSARPERCTVSAATSCGLVKNACSDEVVAVRQNDSMASVVLSNGRLMAEVRGGADSVSFLLTDRNFPRQAFCTLTVALSQQGRAEQLVRHYSADSACWMENFVREGVRYKAEAFLSRPDQTLALRLTSNGSDDLHCRVRLSSPYSRSAKLSKNQLVMVGNGDGNPRQAVHFCTVARVTTNGSVSCSGNQLLVSGADTVEVYLVSESGRDSLGPGHDRRQPDFSASHYLEKAMDEAWHLVNYSFDSLMTRSVMDKKGYRHLINSLNP